MTESRTRLIALALGLALSVCCRDNGQQQQARPLAPGDAAQTQRVEAQLKKTEAALQSAREVGTQLGFLMPVYRRLAAFERETSPDIATVLSGTGAGQKTSDVGSVQPAIFHMVSAIQANSQAYQTARQQIVDSAAHTSQGVAPAVRHVLDLYATAIEASLDCTEQMQHLQKGEWWCKQDPDFQKYVERYTLQVVEASGNRCYGVRDAIATVCGAAYSATRRANDLYRSE